ncbi:putative NADP-dependent oxidoreductase P1 [Triticum urartu]|uniref:Putative NADP-dependent oxidoreductase P1 n=1 Tax=Triticum urartu TaxID=4572 RepID=M7ZPK0_TRIUA|nr:putative NADP-dependent oxidoreductase P1 [Triticum urartu]
MAAAEVSNKGVILKQFVTGCPTEDDLELVTGVVRLAVPPGSASVMVKNLYVSCDPYMRNRMSEHNEASYIEQFVPGECTILKKFAANIEELKEEASTDQVAIAHLEKGIPIKTFTKEEHT